MGPEGRAVSGAAEPAPPRPSVLTEGSPPGRPGGQRLSLTHPAHSGQRSEQLPFSTRGGISTSSLLLLFGPSVVSKSL